jgi:hypothetical protein
MIRMREQIGHDGKPYGIDVIDVRIRALARMRLR